ncbi:TetR family transcriptional regulator [Virgisporangium aliadipatigenens]|uniref:TetR family transcriptional regulator n=1 Tax=Virgisporangium aliadipatigenens TaxID=741659 RepID=A0A8J3YH22_9ACTN|nr:TetR/AcrR family transcriptional regulator [Virgisporangium aliadipatigenens]GIJ44956.1 TetR family transcriptional regulator [Virgisporangium aliadipatigenens]
MSSRRDELCDVAITLIARVGLRGLTHRAVDREAGVPEGSTSYYFRTRNALLAAVTRRMAAIDAQARRPAGGTDPEALADLATALVLDLTGPGRERTLARYELSMEAARQPDLREALHAAGAGMRRAARDLLAAAGAAEPERQGPDLVAFLDGLVYDQLAGAGGPRTPTALRASIREVLRGMLGR